MIVKTGSGSIYNLGKHGLLRWCGKIGAFHVEAQEDGTICVYVPEVFDPIDVANGAALVSHTKEVVDV